jgi:hypothetical protein
MDKPVPAPLAKLREINAKNVAAGEPVFCEVPAAKSTAKPATMCQWFFLCPNEATATAPHPVLGSVPCCHDCYVFATS